MKQGWKIKKIGDVVQKIFAGGDKPHMFSERQTDICCVPVYGNGVTNDGLCGYTDHYVVNERCLTVSARGTVGYCCVRNDPFVPIVRLITIIPQESIGVEFLCYALSTIDIENNGVAIPQLTVPMIKNVSIPVPPIAEQEKIVAELDCLSGIIEKKKQQLKELDNLAQSIFYEMFGEHADGRDKWKIAKLGNVCKTTSGGTPSKGHPEYYEGGDIPWLRSGEVNKMNIYETELFITEDGLNNSSAKWFPKGTVVIAMYGATVGQVGILCNPMTTNQAICGIFPNETFTPIYLYHFLLSKKPEYLEIATGGAQANISQNIVRDTVVSCPPLTLQQDFASQIESIEKQKELIALSIKETETLFNSRMDYYFN